MVDNIITTAVIMKDIFINNINMNNLIMEFINYRLTHNLCIHYYSLSWQLRNHYRVAVRYQFPSCLQQREPSPRNECILHVKHAFQNRFYFGNLDFVFCCHIFGYNKKMSLVTFCKLIHSVTCTWTTWMILFKVASM